MRVSITLLQYEHGIIRQVIDCLKEIVAKELPDKHLEHAVQIHAFLLDYMDGFHHTKEERFIFPRALKGSDLGAITDELIRDHERARELLARMNDCMVDGSIKDREGFLDASDELVDSVTEHIREEEDHAFPMFESIISIGEDEDLANRFKEFTIMEFDEAYPRRSEDLAFKIENEVLGPGFYEGVA